MNATTTFGLAVVLSAINRTGSVFGAVERQVSGLQRSFGKTQDAVNKLFNIGSTISVCLGTAFAKQGMEMEKI